METTMGDGDGKAATQREREDEEQRIYDELQRLQDADEVATLCEITVEDVRYICGKFGHSWEVYDNGDGMWVRTYTVCSLCGASPDDEDGGPWNL